MWSDKPVNMLNDFTILSGLLVNIRSICVLDEFVILAGPRTTCVRSNLSDLFELFSGGVVLPFML